MTATNDALAEIAGPPRDRWGRYLLPHPEHPDDKPRSFTRATTVAKAPEDQGGLIKWGQRMVTIGLGKRPDLVALAASTDPDDKRALGRIAKDAEEAGGAATGRNTGTAIHAAIEAVNRGNEPLPLFAAEVQAYRDALAAAGLEPVSELVERIVVDADREIAGTFDVALRDRDGNLYVADLKTGSVAYPAGMAIQLAIYANATHLVARNFTDYEAMPDWSKDRGIIIHLPPGGPCELHWIDLTAGARGLKIAMQVRSWRSDAKAQTLLSPVSAGTAASGPADAGEAPSSPSVASPASASSNEWTVAPDLTKDQLEQLKAFVSLDWFNARYDEVVNASGREAVKAAWPSALPTPKHRDTWTRGELEQACALVQKLHDDAGLAFPPPDPAAAKLRRKPKDSGKPATEDQKAELRARFDTLDAAGKTAVLEWQSEGTEAARRWIPNNKDKATRWTCAVNSAAVGIASHTTDAEIARGWIALVIGEEDTQSHPVGALLGSLTVTEAEKLASLTSEDTFAAAVEAAA